MSTQTARRSTARSAITGGHPYGRVSRPDTSLGDLAAACGAVWPADARHLSGQRVGTAVRRCRGRDLSAGPPARRSWHGGGASMTRPTLVAAPTRQICRTGTAAGMANSPVGGSPSSSTRAWSNRLCARPPKVLVPLSCTRTARPSAWAGVTVVSVISVKPPDGVRGGWANPSGLQAPVLSTVPREMFCRPLVWPDPPVAVRP